jgi:hypothetical protein
MTGNSNRLDRWKPSASSAKIITATEVRNSNPTTASPRLPRAIVIPAGTSATSMAIAATTKAVTVPPPAGG